MGFLFGRQPVSREIVNSAEDMFGRDRRGRMPRGGHTAESAQTAVSNEIDPDTARKLYRKARGKRTLTQEESNALQKRGRGKKLNSKEKKLIMDVMGRIG
jgi:hypothetical protein